MIQLVPALLCLLWLQTLQPPRDGAAAAKTGTARITGRVLAGSSDTGVSSATVYVVVNGPTPLPHAALTDRSGRFTIDKLPAGSYRLSAMPPENTARYLPTESATRPVEVEDGAAAVAPDIRLPLAAAISGRIVDERGEPLSHVQVYAMGQRYGIPKLQRLGQGYQIHTDDQGRFRIFGLPAGELIVVAETSRRFSRPGDVDRPAGFVTTYYPDVVSEAEARRITLRQGADIDGIEIRMTRMRTFHISGIVIDSRGVPFSGAGVGLHHSVNGSGSTTPINVGTDGRFEARAVLPGRYRIVIGAFDGGPFSRSPATEYASVPVDVADSNVEDLVITTRPATDLTVRVVFEPGPRERVPAGMGLIGWTPRDLGLRPPQAELAADSTVLLKGAMGPLVIRPMLRPGRSEWFLKAVLLGTRDITDTPTEFTPDDATRVRVIFSARAASVTGTVTDEAGKPTREYAVVLFPEERSEWIEYSSRVLDAGPEKNGDYEISGVRAGRYRIAAIDRGRLNRIYFDRANLLESIVKDSVAITVTENEQRVVDLRRLPAEPK